MWWSRQRKPFSNVTGEPGMNGHNLIPFDPESRILKKAAEYVDDVEWFLKDRHNAVPTLKKALKLAENDFKKQILLLLGGTADTEIALLLYGLMADPREHEEIRQSASIQLAISAPLLANPSKIFEKLISALQSKDPVLRSNAAFALGWEGNGSAALPLIELLYDANIDVQQSAVNALSNLQDDRLLNLLADRLELASLEQKRSILFNLWQFDTRRKEVFEIYNAVIQKGDPLLRLDALHLLDTVAETGVCAAVYKKCLTDADPRIRSLAREKLHLKNRLTSLDK